TVAYPHSLHPELHPSLHDALPILPGQLTKYPVAVHHGIRHPGQGIAAGCGDHLVDVQGRVHNLAMLAALRVDTRFQFQVGPLPGTDQAPTQCAAVNTREHGLHHHSAWDEVTQAVVVHDVVGVVVVDLRLDTIEGVADTGFLEAQTQAFTLELATVHATPGIACVAITPPCGQFHQGIRIRRPAQRHIG